jgi:hypothetical protein
MFALVVFIFIVVAAAIFEKTITIMKTSDCFAEKSRGRSEPQKEVRYFSP